MKRKIQDSQDIEMLENIRLLMGISDRVLKYIDNISDDYFFSDERAKEKFYKNFTKRKINQKLEEKQPKNDEPIQIILDDSRPINYFDEGQSHFQQVYDSSK